MSDIRQLIKIVEAAYQTGPIRLWFNPKTKKFVNTGEDAHNVYVVDNPDEFGISDTDLSGVGGDDYEENEESMDLRDVILSKGWVRCGVIGKGIYAEGKKLKDVQVCLMELLKKYSAETVTVDCGSIAKRLRGTDEIERFLKTGRVN